MNTELSIDKYESNNIEYKNNRTFVNLKFLKNGIIEEYKIVFIDYLQYKYKEYCEKLLSLYLGSYI